MAALTPSACRAGLKAALESVAGIGLVHDYRRQVRDGASVRERYFHPATGRIHGWAIAPDFGSTVSNERNPSHPGAGLRGGAGDIITARWQFEGYYGIDDANASEKTFFDLVWLVADTFNGLTLNITGCARQSPCDVVQFGYVLFANMYTLHYARLTIALMGRPR